MSPSAGLQTFINDLQRQKDRRISVMVKCIDTTRIENGVLCCMHPAEGFWLFKVSAELLSVCFKRCLCSAKTSKNDEK